MEDYDKIKKKKKKKKNAPLRRGRRWLLIGGLAFAFMLAMGVGAYFLGTSTGDDSGLSPYEL